MRAVRHDALNRLGWVVYVMVAPSDGAAVYLKIGVTQDLPKRVGAVQTGCPIQIDELLYHKALTRESALAIERAMHAELLAYRTSGEWFRFLLDDPQHKREFNGALKIATARHPDTTWKWNRVRVAGLRAAVTARPESETSAEARRRVRQIHRLVNGRAY